MPLLIQCHGDPLQGSVRNENVAAAVSGPVPSPGIATSNPSWLSRTQGGEKEVIQT